MDCSFINNHLAEIAEKALDAKQAQQCSAHLSQCDTCTRLVRSFEEAWRLDPAQRLEPSGEFYYKVMEKIEQKSSPAQYIQKAFRNWQLVLQPLAAAALVALGIWFGAYLGAGSSGTQTNLAAADNFGNDYYAVLSVFPDGSSGELYQEIAQAQKGDE
jgi:hypothetical protein